MDIFALQLQWLQDLKSYCGKVVTVQEEKGDRVTLLFYRDVLQCDKNNYTHTKMIVL